jgi:hypothetical protein
MMKLSPTPSRPRPSSRIATDIAGLLVKLRERK